MHHCSTTWATYLMSLKALVESGTGAPSPSDVHIAYPDWATSGTPMPCGPARGHTASVWGRGRSALLRLAGRLPTAGAPAVPGALRPVAVTLVPGAVRARRGAAAAPAPASTVPGGALA
jgi:hypothetical protein